MTITFTTPVLHPKAEGYNLSIDGKWWRTVAGPGFEIQLGSRDSLAVRQDNLGSENFPVLDIGYAWARTNLSGGEGLDWSPREIQLSEQDTALDHIRFWDSYNIDVARSNTQDQRYAISLVRDNDTWLGTPTAPADIAISASNIFVADGAVVSWYASWTNITPVGSDTLATNVVAMAAAPNGTVVAVGANGNAYAMRYPTESTFSLAYTAAGADYAATGVWYVNGRFILGTFDGTDNGDLRSLDYVSATWVDAVIDTATHEFWQVVESGPAVVAACDDGTVRSYTPDNASGGTFALEPRARTQMPVGETPIGLGSNANILLILTKSDSTTAGREDVRLYQAEVLDARFDYSVGQLQLRREWIDAGPHPGDVTRNMVNTRDTILFVVNEQNEAGAITDDAIWVFDLLTAGLSRKKWVPNVDLGSLSIFENEIGAIDHDAPDLYLEHPTQLVAEGRMLFPNLTFGLNTPISWIATVVEVANLIDGGAQVELMYSTDPEAIHDYDHASWTLAQRLSSQGATNIEKPLKGVKSRTLSLQLRIYSTTSQTRTPYVTRVAIRGIPAHRDFIMLVPINVSDYVSAPGRKPMRMAGLGDSLHTELLDLIGSSVEAELLDPPLEFRGILNNVSEPITYQPPRGSVTRYCMAEFRGQRVVAGQIGTGTEAVGIGLTGVSLAGVEDNLETT